MTIVGLFLQTILIPIQDFDTISKEELKNIQLDLAINYPLGTGMLYVGLPLLVCSSGYLVIWFFVILEIGRTERRVKISGV